MPIATATAGTVPGWPAPPHPPSTLWILSFILNTKEKCPIKKNKGRKSGSELEVTIGSDWWIYGPNGLVDSWIGSNELVD
ncbi:unnamed protein product [Linum trigynum]|uniref:Uncharacterized protein n=1 Tax=Linum trigynum TaxID=586398 RepID=A0AAV2FG42_9ROSI